MTASMFAAGPLQAQTIIDNQSHTAGQTQHKTNSTKQTSTIATVILNVVPAFTNTRAGSNAVDPVQLIDFTQANDLASEIVIVNSGFIDPAIGIFSQINNTVGSFANNAAMSNAYGATASEDVTQELKLTQSNIVANEITKNNTGNIIAGLYGIFAEINNLAVGSLANNLAPASNANGAAATISLGDVSQSGNFIQTNTIASDITIVNRGNLDAATGIMALINTDLVGSLANNAAGISNANGGAAAIALLDLTQSADLVQSNTIGSSIEIHNYGAATGADTGIVSEINNRTIGSLANNTAGISNANGTAAAVAFADLSQLIDLQQSNEISGDLSLYNYGSIDSDCCGINAQIHTRTIGNLANNATGLSNANGSAQAITLADLNQSTKLDQANTIDNGIGIYNNAEISSGVGIYALLDTQDVSGLFNSVTAINANGGAALVDAEDATQSFDLDQENIVESQIVINNSSSMDAGGVGIHAVIATSDIDRLRNTIDAENLNGNAALVTVGSLDQSANFTQYNTVFSQIVIDDTGGVDAATGIQAEITSRSLDLANGAALQNVNGTATLIDDDDLEQSADIVQKNAVTNDISIKTGGSLTASGTGIQAVIDVDDLQLANTASFAFTNNASGVADDLTQSAEVEQSNIVTSTITVINTGSVKAGDVGISAEILNGSMSLANTANGAIVGAANVSGDTTQSASFTQTNQVESSIAINNSGSIWGANRGIVASISGPVVTAGNTVNSAIGQTSQADDHYQRYQHRQRRLHLGREFVRHRDGRRQHHGYQPRGRRHHRLRRSER